MIREFYLEAGLYDTFTIKHNVPLEDRDNTYKGGSSCIDTVAMTFNLIPFISYIKIEPFNWIFNTDYKSFVFDFNLWLYFGMRTAKPPKPQYLLLNSSRYTHRKSFVEKAEHILKYLELETLADKL